MNEMMLQNAWRLHQAGNLAEAARLYQEVLRSNPRHVGALQMLGFLHFQRSEFEDAEKLMARAVKIEPKSVDALYNRGCALQALDRHKDALHCFDKALAVKRDYAPAQFNRGNSLFRLGRHKEALASYDRALSIQPNYAEALLNRANAMLELERPDEALANYDRAIQLEPRQPILWNNRGNALTALNRHAEALQSYEQALALDPRYADAFENRGDVLERMDQGPESLADYERTLALDPRNASAQHKRARLLAKLNRTDEALAAFDAVLALAPDDIAAWVSKGVTLAGLERHFEALAVFDRALGIDPGNADALSNRANTLLHLKRYGDALKASDTALKREPAHAAALHNRASALTHLRRHADAITSFDRALAAAPENAASWNGRGAAFLGLKRFDDALKSFDVAIGFSPSDADMLANKAATLSKLKRYQEAAETAERALAVRPGWASAMRERVHASLHSCDWHALSAQKADISAALAGGKGAVHAFDNLALSESEQQNRNAAQLYAEEEYPVQPPVWRGETYRHDKIRLGYLSTDLRAHAIGFLIVGTLEHHDKSRFETIGLSLGHDDGSEVRARIVSACDRFADLRGLNDDGAAALMREMEIDIAIDLNGYTGDSRTGILARRPAPIQVNYLGYPGTMGAPYIDYILADRIVIPESMRSHYAEQVVYLPDAYQANDSDRRVSAKPVTRRDAGLPDDGFVFCSLSSSYKFAPETFNVWMRLLAVVNGSVLWLLYDNPDATANLRREAEMRGVAPDRLVFAPHAPPDEHLARQRLADLFLDTLPYNAHTTASDALWMGLPVVTCTGPTFPARVATSILFAAGLPELVADSLAGYEVLALRLATNPNAYRAVKAKVDALKGTCALFDTARFARYLESAFATMLDRHRQGLAPESFAVPPEPAR